jgi:DNA (cytosine-5)-methyltransferase 1
MKKDADYSQLETRKRTCIDLFAGAGGLSTGLELAGFDVLFANEIVNTYAKTLAQNHPHSEIYVDDIRALDPEKIRSSLNLGVGELDLVAGGPPCQGFSINAPIRSNDDERNHLFLNYLNFVKEFRPKVVLIENVPGMVSFDGGNTIKSIISSLKNLGYNPDVRVLYAPHFGVPQMRWRTIFLATRLDFSPHALYPIPRHNIKGRPNFTSRLDGDALTFSENFVTESSFNAPVTVNDAISDLPEISNGGGSQESIYTQPAKTEYQKFLRKNSNFLLNHQCARLGDINIARMEHIPPGGSWRDIPFDLLPKGMQRARRSDHTKRYGRLDPNGIASTILTKCDPHWGSYIHPTQNRVLSVREAARLQSFPDWVKFHGSVTEQYEQVGNAVPPLFAKSIGEQIRSILLAHENGTPIELPSWSTLASGNLPLFKERQSPLG